MVFDRFFVLFYGATDTITKLDFTPFGVKFMAYNGSEFNLFLDQFEGGHEQEKQTISEHFPKNKHLWKFVYACVPINIEDTFSYKHYCRIENALLIMCPCQFRQILLVNYNPLSNGKFVMGVSFPGLRTRAFSIVQEMVHFEYTNRKAANYFISLYVERQDDSLLSIPLEAFYSSFQQITMEMKYINLFIALESLIEGNSEITYKIRRLCAVVNSNDDAEGEIIFSTVGQLYALRSKIVHGMEVQRKYVEECYVKLRAIVSRTIIELMILNFTNKKALTKKIDSHGFGDKKVLNTGYKPIIPNPHVINDMLSPIVNETSKDKKSH